MELKELLVNSQEWLFTSGLNILVIVILIVIALKLASVLSRKLLNIFSHISRDSEMKKRADTLGAILRYVFSSLVLLIGLVMILGEFRIEIGPILAAAGVAGLAIGFGAQHIIKDMISGFFILMDDEIRVGDAVEIGGKGGLVERINLRVTVLRDVSGNVHYIANGSISVVTNMTKDYSRYVFDVGVSYRENVDEVIGVLKKVDENLRADPEFADDIIGPLEILGLDRFTDSAVIIRARYMTRPLRQWRTGREFNRRLKKFFDENDIQIPFPHMTLYLGREKDGSPQPLKVLVDKNNSAGL